MNIAFEARDPFGGAFGELEAALSSIEGVGEVTNETPKFSWPGAAPAIEVIWIYLGLKAADKVAGRIVERAFDAAVSWARKTLKAEKNVPSEGRWYPHERNRPQHIIIFDSNGKVLRSVLVRDFESPAEDIPAIRGRH